MQGSTVAPFLLVLALLAGQARAASQEGKEPPAADPPEGRTVQDAPEKEAKDALESFERSFATTDLDFKVEAVERLRRVIHPKVADRLLALAIKDPEPLVRAAAFKGLGRQKTSKSSLGPKLARFLSQAAEEGRKAKARGDYGVLVDVKTGEVDTESDAGKAALRAKRERGRMLAAAVDALDALGHREKDSVDCLREFLSDGNDDLVAHSLKMLGKWKVWSVLDPDFLQLFEMYPKEDEFQTGSATVDTGASGSGDQQAAKRKWMGKYGDPDKRRPRPKVVKALKQALLDITGEKFEEPKALREYTDRPEVKRKMKYGG